jgi:hypothetical protein
MKNQSVGHWFNFLLPFCNVIAPRYGFYISAPSRYGFYISDEEQAEWEEAIVELTLPKDVNTIFQHQLEVKGLKKDRNTVQFYVEYKNNQKMQTNFVHWFI